MDQDKEKEEVQKEKVEDSFEFGMCSEHRKKTVTELNPNALKAIIPVAARLFASWNFGRLHDKYKDGTRSDIEAQDLVDLYNLEPGDFLCPFCKWPLLYTITLDFLNALGVKTSKVDLARAPRIHTLNPRKPH